jgi:hypothetical protein
MIAARHGRLIGLAAAAVLAGLAPAARGDDLVELCTRVRSCSSAAAAAS